MALWGTKCSIVQVIHARIVEGRLVQLTTGTRPSSRPGPDSPISIGSLVIVNQTMSIESQVSTTDSGHQLSDQINPIYPKSHGLNSEAAGIIRGKWGFGCQQVYALSWRGPAAGLADGKVTAGFRVCIDSKQRLVILSISLTPQKGITCVSPVSHV
ncbi:General transcriptional corepressor ssn6 [Fusarium oxysporum f. sp. albedinis]|nr:General transcriptional corepressor ssn6 [Fusarium oxysporum f. sp. albedinis]